jgi:uncharacterized protein with PQ loop repeat
MHELALFAGSAAAAIFMIAQLPMLIKAGRTRNLASYSFANIALANVGNLLYSVYVLHVPVGPVWAIHLFNQATSGLMLFWYLRYRRTVRPAELSPTQPAEPSPTQLLVMVDARSAE